MQASRRGGHLLGPEVLLRIVQDYIVAAQQARIAFDQHGEPAALVAEAEPGAAIGQRVGTHRLEVDRLPRGLDRAEAGG